MCVLVIRSLLESSSRLQKRAGTGDSQALLTLLTLWSRVLLGTVEAWRPEAAYQHGDKTSCRADPATEEVWGRRKKRGQTVSGGADGRLARLEPALARCGPVTCTRSRIVPTVSAISTLIDDISPDTLQP